MFTAYNLRRLFNILDKNILKEYFRIVYSYLIIIIDALITEISLFKTSKHLTKLRVIFSRESENQPVFR